MTAPKIDAPYIAAAYLGKEPTPLRLEKAKALAKRAQVDWAEVQPLIQEPAP